jgi:SAM-dependent methyltransferase
LSCHRGSWPIGVLRNVQPTVPQRAPRTIVFMTTLTDLKQVHRATWAAGDYAAVAEHIDTVPPSDLLDRITIRPGQDVLDVAAGTGNAALRAASRGGRVTGLDLAPELFVTARRRAFEQGVDITWVQGDAEDLPFDNDSFDHVLSVFGVQFAPRHEVTATELDRVCRPGGQVGLINWTPAGVIGEFFAIMSRYLPTPPSYASSPPLWGDEDHVRHLFADTGIDVTFSYGTNPWSFDSAEHWVAFLETAYGPTVKARQRLIGEGTWDACRSEIVAMAERRNQAADGTLLLQAEYLITLGRKAS